MTVASPLGADVERWIETSIGSGARVTSARALEPSSTEKHAVDADTDGGPVRVVLRRYHDRERLATDFAYDPVNEAKALELLEGTAVPAPRLIGADLAGAISGAPLLIESWVEGLPSWEPPDLEMYLRGAAEALVRIHEVDPSGTADVMAYRPYIDARDRTVPTGTMRREMWERARSVLDGPAPDSASIFIHRDYHPGNALWDGTRIAGVVDWSTAAIGPPGIDVARMRQNLAGWHGAASADRFARCYVAAGGREDARHPYWDLLDAEIAPGEEVGAPGGGDTVLFEDYVERVLAELG